MYFSILKCRSPVEIAMLLPNYLWSIWVIKIQVMAEKLTYCLKRVIKMSMNTKSW